MDARVRSVFLGTVKGLSINILLICSWPLQGRGLACSTGGPCTARSLLTVSCDFPSAAFHYPVRAPSAYRWGTMCNHLQLIANHPAQPVQASAHPHVPQTAKWSSGAPRCLPRGPPGSLEHNGHPFFLAVEWERGGRLQGDIC